MRVSFHVTGSVSQSAQVSTRAGIEFRRRYVIRDGSGLVEWTPETAGPAVLRIRVRGGQGQTTTKTLRIAVSPAPRPTARPTVTLIRVPTAATVGRPSRVVFRVTDARVAVARIAPEDGEALVWRFPNADDIVVFAWTPARRGSYVLTVTARGSDGVTTQTATRLAVGRLL